MRHRELVATARGRPRFRHARVGLLGLLLGIAWAGCARQPAPTEAEGPAEPSSPRNVLLISLDACRADRLGSYGNPRDTSPFLDELATRGVRFANAFVNTHGTPTSHATMLSSAYQETHRLQFAQPGGEVERELFPTTTVMVQELLRAHGYVTLAVTDGGYASHIYGFDRGFMEFKDRYRGVAEGTDTLRRLIRRYQAMKRPIFALYHTYEIHSPYDPPPEYRDLFGEFAEQVPTSNEYLLSVNEDRRELSEEQIQYLLARYDAGIRYADDTLRGFFDELTALGFLDNCLVIVTADHGEEFGEHGGLLHRGHLYDELLRVPLIVQGPGVPAGRVDERLVCSVDLVPTILGYADVPSPWPMEGIDLLAPGRGHEVVFSQYGGVLYSARTARWKLIKHPDRDYPKLFDLVADPGETRNVAGEHPEVRDELLAEIEAFRSGRGPLPGLGGRTGVEESHSQRQLLEELGYVD